MGDRDHGQNENLVQAREEKAAAHEAGSYVPPAKPQVYGEPVLGAGVGGNGEDGKGTYDPKRGYGQGSSSQPRPSAPPAQYETEFIDKLTVPGLEYDHTGAPILAANPADLAVQHDAIRRIDHLRGLRFMPEDLEYDAVPAAQDDTFTAAAPDSEALNRETVNGVTFLKPNISGDRPKFPKELPSIESTGPAKLFAQVASTILTAGMYTAYKQKLILPTEIGFGTDINGKVEFYLPDGDQPQRHFPVSFATGITSVSINQPYQRIGEYWHLINVPAGKLVKATEDNKPVFLKPGRYLFQSNTFALADKEFKKCLVDQNAPYIQNGDSYIITPPQGTVGFLLYKQQLRILEPEYVRHMGKKYIFHSPDVKMIRPKLSSGETSQPASGATSDTQDKYFVSIKNTRIEVQDVRVLALEVGEQAVVYGNDGQPRILSQGSHALISNKERLYPDIFNTTVQTLDVAFKSILSKDFVDLNIEGVVSYQITDLNKLIRKVKDNHEDLIKNRVLAVLNGVVRANVFNEKRMMPEDQEVARKKAKPKDVYAPQQSYLQEGTEGDVSDDEEEAKDPAAGVGGSGQAAGGDSQDSEEAADNWNDKIKDEFIKKTQQIFKEYGIEIKRVEITKADPNKQELKDKLGEEATVIAKTNVDLATAAAKRKVAEINALAEAQVSRTQAEGNADAKLLEATAEAKGIELTGAAKATAMAAMYEAEAKGLEDIAKVAADVGEGFPQQYAIAGRTAEALGKIGNISVVTADVNAAVAAMQMFKGPSTQAAPRFPSEKRTLEQATPAAQNGDQGGPSHTM